MIIGKSLTALGGGGLKPEIRVTAKAGALLNLHYKDSSIILQSYQLGAEETQHTFVVDVSETVYVVEDATNGKSVEVLVDAVAVFNVEIVYKLEILSANDLHEDITGGYTYTSGWGLSFASDGSLYVTRNGSWGTNPTTNKSFDLSKYSKMHYKTRTDKDGQRPDGGYWNAVINIYDKSLQNSIQLASFWGTTWVESVVELPKDISFINEVRLGLGGVTNSWYSYIYFT